MMTVSYISDCNYHHHHLNNTSTLLSLEKTHHHHREDCVNAMPIDSQQLKLDHFPRQPMTSHYRPPVYNYTWLVFKEERWQPFDTRNQFILEETLSVDGTFVDISDSLFPGVKRVRVFPRNNYLSYLGLKYRMSRVLQPDAWSWST